MIQPDILRFFHTGDLGDIIASLPIVRSLGGGEFVIGDVPMRSGMGRRQTMKGERFEFIRPLIEAQPYIRSVIWEERPTRATHDFSTFRTTRNFHGSTISDWQARYLHLPKVDYTPWLTAVEHGDTKGRVIVARSPRYHEPEFPWTGIIERIGDRALFIGLPDEHTAFEEYVGRKVEYVPRGTMLDVAQAIAGADLTIVNQTSTFWVAAGLGVPLIQETCRRAVDSIVLRPNARYPMHAVDYQQVLRSFDCVPA